MRNKKFGDDHFHPVRCFDVFKDKMLSQFPISKRRDYCGWASCNLCQSEAELKMQLEAQSGSEMVTYSPAIFLKK